TQFGNPIGRVGYMATMGANVGSEAINKLTRDGEWDEVTNSFHKYENLTQRLAAFGSSSIDIAQTVMPGVLSRANSRGFGGVKNDAFTTGVAPTRMTAGGREFNVEWRNGAPFATAENK